MKGGRFDSQREMWEHLLSGGSIIWEHGSAILGRDGNLINREGGRVEVSDPSLWAPFTPPKKPRVAEAFRSPSGHVFFAIAGSREAADLTRDDMTYKREPSFDIVEKSE